MPIDRDFNLDNPEGITEEDIRQMEEEADRIEAIAKRAEEAQAKIESVGAPIKGMSFAQLSIIDKALGEEGTRKTDSGGTTTAGEVGGMSKEDLMDLVIEMMKTMEDSKKEREVHKVRLDAADVERKAFEQKVMRLESDISKAYGEVRGLMANPIGFGRGKFMGLLGKAGIYGAIAVFAIQMAQQVYDQVIGEIKGMFQPGGVLDVRKDVLDSTRQIANLDHLINVEQGKIFFTSDTSEFLRQGTPLNYNTRDRVNGYKQYLQEFDR